MEANLGILGIPGGGGGGGGRNFSSGSASGSMSTVSKEDNLVLSSEESSSYPDESELQLGLGLSLGGGGGAMRSKSTSDPPAHWGPYARILTAKDLPSMGLKSSCVNSPSSLSSSSSSSSVTKVNFSASTKRTADSGGSQVVGWPPIRAYRMNNLVNQGKSPAAEEFQPTFEKSKRKNGVVDPGNNANEKKNNTVNRNGKLKTSLFVKVNMDGFPIGRKVDLSAHSLYETLAQTLEDMFCRPNTRIGARGSSMEEHDVMTEATGSPALLDGSSEFVLTYEDKEGDWMLVGDVPWGMFLSSVKRLRIMRTSEANGLGPRLQERNGRQSKPI